MSTKQMIDELMRSLEAQTIHLVRSGKMTRADYDAALKKERDRYLTLTDQHITF